MGTVLRLYCGVWVFGGWFVYLVVEVVGWLGLKCFVCNLKWQTNMTSSIHWS